MFNLIHIQDVPEGMRKNMEEGRYWEGTIYNNRKGTEPLPVDVKVLPVLDGDLNW